MNEKLNLISKLKSSKEARLSYIKGKLAVFIPAQIRALRLKSADMSRQSDLAEALEMQQSRISMFETPGAANFTIDTLARLAAVFRVALIVKFVPFHKMLQEENLFSQDTFDVLKIENDREFTAPAMKGQHAAPSAIVNIFESSKLSPLLGSQHLPLWPGGKEKGAAEAKPLKNGVGVPFTHFTHSAIITHQQSCRSGLVQ
jgi:transcriptional regulator with XRE-family HTH domain